MVGSTFQICISQTSSVIVITPSDILEDPEVDPSEGSDIEIETDIDLDIDMNI